MTEFSYSNLESSFQTLKLDITTVELANIAERNNFSDGQLDAINCLLEYLRVKKEETTIQTILKMSRLPLKDLKTFENFDFSLIRGKDVEKLRALPSLSAIYAHRNLAFIGPAGTGKTHLAQAFGYECCKRGLKTYFIKMSELKDKFTRPDEQEKKHLS